MSRAADWLGHAQRLVDEFDEGGVTEESAWAFMGDVVQLLREVVEPDEDDVPGLFSLSGEWHPMFRPVENVELPTGIREGDSIVLTVDVGADDGLPVAPDGYEADPDLPGVFIRTVGPPSALAHFTAYRDGRIIDNRTGQQVNLSQAMDDEGRAVMVALPDNSVQLLRPGDTLTFTDEAGQIVEPTS